MGRSRRMRCSGSEGGEQTFAAGWALSIAISSYTAPALLIASYAGFSATRVGLVWYGAYTIICGSFLSIWVLAFAHAFFGSVSRGLRSAVWKPT